MNSSIKPEVSEKSFKEHIKPIINNPFNAIVELIANAHDAGATEVHIKWKYSITEDENDNYVEFKDNGTGMSNNEFKEIWKELSYDRLSKGMGENIEININPDKAPISRKVYGKNGKGRHAPFAFSNKYQVKTIKNNFCSIFEISEDSNSGFSIEEISTKQVNEPNGTLISFKINKNDKNLSPEKIKEILATRFLKDPTFTIYLNNNPIKLNDIPSENKTEIECNCNGEQIKIIKIKSNSNSSYMKFHGVSWRFGNRLFSEEWKDVLDGRISVAKQYSFIISADSLKNYVNETMTGFIDNPKIKEIINIIHKCIKESLKKEINAKNEENKKDVIKSNIVSIKKLGVTDQRDIADFITEVQNRCPNIKKEDLNATTEIFINLRKSKYGYQLLHELANYNHNDLDSLNDIIKKWDIQSAKIVLDEIKDRLDLIEELRLKMDNPKTKELQELQPIFEKGLWIFGPEYESIEFTSNKSLNNVVKKIFGLNESNVENGQLRPDFVVVPKIYSSDSYDDEGEVDGLDKLLIVELKKGGFEITLKEIQQTQNYIQELKNGNYISDNMKVKAYVLGSSINVDKTSIGDNIDIIPMSYNVIVSRAEKRLFNLQKKIKKIKNISETGDPIMDDIMKQELLDNFL